MKFPKYSRKEGKGWGCVKRKLHELPFRYGSKFSLTIFPLHTRLLANFLLAVIAENTTNHRANSLFCVWEWDETLTRVIEVFDILHQRLIPLYFRSILVTCTPTVMAWTKTEESFTTRRQKEQIRRVFSFKKLRMR